MQDLIKKIYDYSLEEIMEQRFARYAKSIIQDRAIPDVRDGLKPVQRRILYVMYKAHNTYDKAYKKSGETVGEVMGKFHPHGDTSIYDAMVRMSQWWKNNSIVVDMHGNNGSMDGDSPAAYRYTEARLAKIAEEMLRDLEKNTVVWAPNYSDTIKEPTVLPARYPYLLVNGSTGISTGYATNIPPHNLGEVIDATIKRIDSPNCHLSSILDIVKGPDFPTGGIVEGIDGINDAYTTGRGRVIVKSKYEFIKDKKQEQIIIHEIPYDVNKSTLVKRIDDIRIDKKIDGIIEVRDESDRENPIRIVIDLKQDADKELVINYLLKNTELQISYNFNMVAIVNHRPMTLGILEILDAYIVHQKEVVTKRTEYDLENFKARMHIVEGLIKALSILDEVIKTIRASKNKTDAKDNLVAKYGFTELQADAIVMLQLYKLTNTDVTELEEEAKKLALIIKGLEAVLADEEKLKALIKEELRRIKKEYGIPRRSEIREEITEIKIEQVKMLPKEDTVVVVTNEGYVKRVSLRSYNAVSNESTTLKEGDFVTGLYELNTLDTILLFTDLGNYLYVPVHELPDLKWKEIGKHISNIIKIEANENIIKCVPVVDFDKKEHITVLTKNGMIKRTLLSEFKVQRYSKPIACMKLKDKDKVVSVLNDEGTDILIATKNGIGLRYSIDEVTPIGLKGSGVKAISLKNDEVVSAHIFSDDGLLSVITDKKTGKRVKLSDFEKTSRGRKGVQLIRDVKTNPYYVIKTFILPTRTNLGIKTSSEIVEVKLSDLPISDRYSTGSIICKNKILDVFEESILQKPSDIVIEKASAEEVKKEISLQEIDEKILTIDDFLDDFKMN